MSGIAVKEIPEDWVKVKLGDIVNIVYGKNLPTKDLKEEGYPVYGANGIIGKYDRYLYEDEQVLISCRGAYSGKANMSPPHAYITNNSLVLETPEESGLNKKYLYYWLNIADKSSLVTGSAQPQVTINNAVELSVPLAPPEQQKRIVAKIEELFSHIDAGIEALKKAKQLLKQYRQSVLKAAVTGELTKEWREVNKGKLEPASQLLDRILKERRKKWEEQQLEQFKAKSKIPKDDKWKEKYKEPVGATVDDLPVIPEEWVWATLPQLGELNRGKSKHRPRNDPSLYGGEYPFVQTGDVRAANTWLKEFSQTYSDKGLAQSRLWPKGTMCITIAANIADTAILEFDACFPDSVVGFIPLNDSVNVEVVEFFIRTVKSDLEKYAPATAQKNINLAILETVAIPLLPVDEQEELINSLKYKMSMADRLEDEIDHQLIKTEKNKQSVLASAFSGNLQ